MTVDDSSFLYELLKLSMNKANHITSNNNNNNMNELNANVFIISCFLHAKNRFSNMHSMMLFTIQTKGNKIP